MVLALFSIDSVARTISEERIRPPEETMHSTHCVVFVEEVDREYEELRLKGAHFLKPPATQPGGRRTDGALRTQKETAGRISQRPKK